MPEIFVPVQFKSAHNALNNSRKRFGLPETRNRWLGIRNVTTPNHPKTFVEPSTRLRLQCSRGAFPQGIE